MTEMISGVENADDPIAAGEADALDEQLVGRARADCTGTQADPSRRPSTGCSRRLVPLCDVRHIR
jgi:hypothetical protein